MRYITRALLGLALCCLLGRQAMAIPEQSVTLRMIHGRPMPVRADGTPLSFIAYCNCKIYHYMEYNDYFIHSGVKTYFLNVTGYDDLGADGLWTTHAQYRAPISDEYKVSMEHQAEDMLKRLPDAHFIVRFGLEPNKAWCDTHPGDLQTDSDGKQMRQPSLASDAYIEQLPGYVKSIVDFCERHPWGKQVVGYAGFQLGEGTTLLTLEGHFYDRSEAMQRAWRDWLTRKYATDAALAAAWGQKNISLATIAVPHDAELREKANTLDQWPEPALMAMERDYALLQKDLYRRWFTTIVDSMKQATASRPVPFFMDAMKQHMFGWYIKESFYGKGDITQNARAFSFFLGTGSIGVGDLLDLPGLSGLITPADYQARGMGFAFEGEGLSDSLVLRGKMQYIENDARTWISNEMPSGDIPLGSFLNAQEARAGFLRNSAMCLSRGLQHYWMDIGGGFFNSDKVQQQIRVDKHLLEAGLARPRVETEHAIAMIIDDESPLYENFTRGFQHLALIRQRIDGLGLSGIPYRIYLLSDLKKANFPRYRCYLFPNLFKVDEATIALLKEKVFRDGSIAIFGPATGITDGKTLGAAWSEKLLGIPMAFHNSSSGRRVRITDRSLKPLQAKGVPPMYGDTLTYGPMLTPERDRLQGTNVQVLGEGIFSFYVNGPGLVLKEFGRGPTGNGHHGPRGAGDYGVVFTGALPLPPAVLRGLARYGGCNVWCDDDVVISADDDMISLHSTEHGPFTIHLPHMVKTVTDALTGTVVARQAQTFTVTLSPPETKVFFLEN